MCGWARRRTPSELPAPRTCSKEKRHPLMSDWGFTTRAIHVAQEPEPRTGAVITPIYQTSTFAQDDIGAHRGYEYSRTDNPTRDVVEDVVASLEGARYGLAFA